MATSKQIRIKEEDVSLHQDSDLSTCEACGSADIKQIREGYVCGNCGLVLSDLVLEYHHPYQVSTIQHAPKGKTQIGYYKERVANAQSVQLQKWQQLDSERDRKEEVKKLARREIRRILSGLGLPLVEVEPVFKKFVGIRGCIRPGTKYRSVEKLVPITIYLHFKLNCKGISEQELLEISHINKKQFNAFKLQLRAFLPEYQARNRKNYVLQKILQITEEFELGMEFYNNARGIMHRLWEIIKNTKDDVIAGVVCSIVALCEPNRELRVNTLCTHLGIQMSTIQRQVEQNVFNHLRVRGFKSLISSSGLLRKVMVKLGLIDHGEEEIISVLQITLGNAVDIYNAHDDEVLPLAPCLLVVQTTSGTRLLMDDKYPLIRGEFVNSKHIIHDGVLGGRVLSCQFTEYEYPKGPP